eukprot:TRINITY_DN14156_c0_g1_i1.p1 TRINITY_DN14156_c0_g1~~TRINITY_DN14156_c0_g1_i1.p1  ORF type:complete len:220 (-),score=63.08 TRINITY_DN14156_c0_g1_i1:9-668(-)
MAAIQERNRSAARGLPTLQASAALRQELNEVQREVGYLGDALRRIQRDPAHSGITEAELLRRHNLVLQLRQRVEELQRLVRMPPASARAPPAASGGLLSEKPRGRREQSEESELRGAAELRELQSQQMREQDDQLDDLLVSVQRQKEIAHSIHTELATQIEMLDDVDANVDSASTALATQSRRLATLGKDTQGSCSVWLLGVLAAVATVLIVVSVAAAR